MKQRRHSEQWKENMRARMIGFRHKPEDIATKMRKTSLNEKAFDTLSEQSIYWIGAILARGCVCYKTASPTSPTITFESSSKLHVEELKTFLNSSRSIYYHEKKNVYTLAISSQKIASVLKPHGIVPKKRYNARASPGLAGNRHLWRGIVDVHGYLRAPNNTIEFPTLRLKSSFPLVMQFKSFIEKNLGQKISANCIKQEVKKHSITLINEDAVQVIKLLYENCSIFLAENMNVASQIVSPSSTLTSHEIPWPVSHINEEKANTSWSREPPIEIKNSHESAIYYLLKLGNTLKFDTWTAHSSNIYETHMLGEISTIQSLSQYLRFKDESVERIDVIWCTYNHLELCFEVTHSTDIDKSLNRLHDLKHLHTNFFIVAKASRKWEFDKQIKKELFGDIADRTHFVSYDELVELYYLTSKFVEKIKILFGYNDVIRFKTGENRLK